MESQLLMFYFYACARRTQDELSSFDVYTREVLSGKLEWSAAHKSEMFWRENVANFEEKDYKLIRVLKQLALREGNSQVQAIACNDLGEFCRHAPNGKAVLDALGVKAVLVGLMSHANADVQREALFAVQKIFVSKWEYLK